MKQPQELTQRTLLGLQKEQLIDHILDLQRYIRYSTGTTFYANHVHETPYGSIYSQTLTAAHKLLGRLQNIPSHSGRVRSKVNVIHKSVTDRGKGRTSQIALLATNSPEKPRAHKPHRPSTTNAKGAKFHARKRTSYWKTANTEKSVIKSEDGRTIYIYLTPKLIENKTKRTKQHKLKDTNSSRINHIPNSKRSNVRNAVKHKTIGKGKKHINNPVKVSMKKI